MIRGYCEYVFYIIVVEFEFTRSAFRFSIHSFRILAIYYPITLNVT